MMIEVPALRSEGMKAAEIGTAMSSTETPLGFTFCPYRFGSVERWNYIFGCVQFYFGEPAPIPGERA